MGRFGRNARAAGRCRATIPSGTRPAVLPSRPNQPHEALHPAGEGAYIDRLLAKHALLRAPPPDAPAGPRQTVQNKQRIRYREEAQARLDTAIRSLIDFRCGITRSASTWTTAPTAAALPCCC